MNDFFLSYDPIENLCHPVIWHIDSEGANISNIIITTPNNITDETKKKHRETPLMYLNWALR